MRIVKANEKLLNVNLPNEKQCRDLCELIHYAFTDIRAYLRDGKADQAEELADIFHAVPQEIHGYGLWDLQSFVKSLRRYQKKHGGTNYISYLNEIFDGI